MDCVTFYLKTFTSLEILVLTNLREESITFLKVKFLSFYDSL